jgi:hypothetical protein
MFSSGLGVASGNSRVRHGPFVNLMQDSNGDAGLPRGENTLDLKGR